MHEPHLRRAWGTSQEREDQGLFGPMPNRSIHSGACRPLIFGKPQLTGVRDDFQSPCE